MTPYLLSILRPWAELVRSGAKRWEFRANPRFGRAGNRQLAPDDALFVVAMDERPEIVCACRVGRILRGDAVAEHFARPGAWRASGCASPEALEQVLAGHAAAVELAAVHALEPRLPVGRIRHAHTGTAWSGRGFCAAAELKRYRLGPPGLGAAWPRVGPTAEDGEVEEALSALLPPDWSGG